MWIKNSFADAAFTAGGAASPDQPEGKEKQTEKWSGYTLSVCFRNNQLLDWHLENTLTCGGSRLRFSVTQIIFNVFDMQLRIHPDDSKYAGLPPWKHVCIFECVASQCPANATTQLCKHDVLQQESSLALNQNMILILSLVGMIFEKIPTGLEIISHLWTPKSRFFVKQIHLQWTTVSSCEFRLHAEDSIVMHLVLV